MKYHVLSTTIIEQRSSKIYRMFKSALCISGSNINSDGLFTSLDLIALEDYNAIIPFCETMVWLNSNSKCGEIKRYRANKLLDADNTLKHLNGNKNDRLNKIIKKALERGYTVHKKVIKIEKFFNPNGSITYHPDFENQLDKFLAGVSAKDKPSIFTCGLSSKGKVTATSLLMTKKPTRNAITKSLSLFMANMNPS